MTSLEVGIICREHDDDYCLARILPRNMEYIFTVIYIMLQHQGPVD